MKQQQVLSVNEYQPFGDESAANLFTVFPFKAPYGKERLAKPRAKIIVYR